MENFEFYSPTKIIFGRNTEERVGKLTREYSKKILFMYGCGNIKKSGLYDKTINSLKNENVSYIEFGGIVPNPKLEAANEAIKIAKNEKIDFILAVGGGSVIDTAKAVAMGVYKSDVWKLYESKEPISKALPVATILTIPAAGSESSPSTVLTNDEKQLKYGYSSPLLRPVWSIINPEIFFTLPQNQIANGISDMMSHIFERYFTNTENNNLTDELCEATLRTIIKNAKILIENPKNYEAWCEIGFSGFVAHNGLLGMGRVEDWGTHTIEHELSALYDIAHGTGLAILTPNWMRYVYHQKPEIFVKFAKNVMNVKNDQEEQMIIEGIDELKKFYKTIKIPNTLKEVGVKKENLELMAKKCTKITLKEKEELVGNFRKLNWQDILEIYSMSYA